MLADPARKLTRYFDVLIEEEGVALRSTFIIDPEGKVVAYEVNNNSIGRPAEELLRKVAAAKCVYDNGGKVVCPASWKPGKGNPYTDKRACGKHIKQPYSIF